MAALSISTDLADDDFHTKITRRKICCGCCCPLPVAAVALFGPSLLLIGWSASMPHAAGVVAGVSGVAASVAVGVVSRDPEGRLAGCVASRLMSFAYGLAAFVVVVLCFVRAVSTPGPPVASGSFPTECYQLWYGSVPSACVRVAVSATAKQLAGLVPNASMPLFARRLPAATIAAEARRFVASTFQASVVSSAEATLHATAVTPLFGLVDDLFVHAACDASTGLASVSAQSEQRLGSGDGGVNAARVRALQAHLRSAAWPDESTSC